MFLLYLRPPHKNAALSKIWLAETNAIIVGENAKLGWAAVRTSTSLKGAMA